MMISLHVDYLRALRRVSFITFLWEKNGVEQIVWPRPPHGDPVTLNTVSVTQKWLPDRRD